MVHGVVVQIENDTGPFPFAPNTLRVAAGSAAGNATQISGSLRGWYSSSASASAVRQCQHHRIDFRSRYSNPCSTTLPRAAVMSASYRGDIVRYGWSQVPNPPSLRNSSR
jgi:hypothetical protein